MSKQIKIQPGQVWETRSGQRILVDEVLTDHGSTPVRAGDHYWQLNGRYWSDQIEHPFDLIKFIQ